MPVDVLMVARIALFLKRFRERGLEIIEKRGIIVADRVLVRLGFSDCDDYLWGRLEWESPNGASYAAVIRETDEIDRQINGFA